MYKHYIFMHTFPMDIFQGVYVSQHLIKYASLYGFRVQCLGFRVQPLNPIPFGGGCMGCMAWHGDDVLAQRLTSAVDELLLENSIVLIEGLRGTAEREVFANHWEDNFLVVAVTASKELRFQRVVSRARSEDGTLSDLEQRDAREAGWGLKTIISEANYTFSNESNLEELILVVTAWLKGL